LKPFNRFLMTSVAIAAAVLVAGCAKKVPPQTVATAPPTQAPQPTATITATPASVTAGSSVVLSWRTTDAATATIDGLGDVSTDGVKTVSPSVSTTYRLVARGQGGTAEDDARVTVSAPAPVASGGPSMSAEEAFRANMRDIFFDYDKYNVRNDAQSTLSSDAAYLTSHPGLKVVIGGYCDERGSDEYNLALGQNRAEYTKNALVGDGVAATRIRIISYGKEKQFCSQSTDSCYQENRRAGFALDSN
jgi:peptidoglycan-associated lipoprotein